MVNKTTLLFSSTLIATALLLSGSVVQAQDKKSLTLNLERVSKSSGRSSGLLHPRLTRPQSWDSYIYQMASKADHLLRGLLRGTVNYNAPVVDENDVQYKTTIYVGSNKQAFSVIIDTGSDKLILNDKTCTQCTAATFDPTSSTTFVNTHIADSIQYQDGSGLSGDKCLETVSFDQAGTYAATQYNFLLGTQESGFESDDGLIGMARTQNADYTQLLDLLYQQGKISSRIFAFYMADSTHQSSLQLGDFDTSYFKNPSASLSYVPQFDTQSFWDTNVQAFSIGTAPTDNNGNAMAWAMQGDSMAILDTGTSIIYVPDVVYSQLMSALMQGIPGAGTALDGSYYGSCDSTLYKSLYILMGGTWFEIPPTVYLETIPQTTSCMIDIGQNQDSTWLLGDTFLKSYYTVWDNDGNRVGLTPHKTSLATTIDISTMPLPTTAFNPVTLGDIISSVVESVLLMAIGGVTAGSAIYIAYVIISYYWPTLMISSSASGKLAATSDYLYL